LCALPGRCHMPAACRAACPPACLLVLLQFLTQGCVPPRLCLQHSRKDVEGCGPDSVVGKLFPRAVGAALSRLVDLLGASLDDAKKVGFGLCVGGAGLGRAKACCGHVGCGGVCEMQGQAGWPSWQTTRA